MVTATNDLSYYSDDCLTEEEKDSFLFLAEFAWKKTVRDVEKTSFCRESEEANTYLNMLNDSRKTSEKAGGGNAANTQRQLKSMSKRLNTIGDNCSTVLGTLKLILSDLEQLQSTYDEAARKTGSLHNQCDTMLADQIRLSERLEELSSCLAFFSDHDRLAARLQSPLVPVQPDTYGAILDRIDQCLAFFLSNRHFKDGPTYEAKYRELLSKAIANIRNQVTNYIKTTSNFDGSHDVAMVSASGGNEEKVGVAYAFLYGRFRLAAFKVRPLVELLESRLDRSPQEYGDAISECHETYARQREALLSPVVAASIADIVGKNATGGVSVLVGAGNTCALLKDVGAFLRRLCQDEQQLYTAFFTHTTQHVDVMLTDLCSCLVDLFRPRIIHSKHVETLAEMCSTVNAELQDSSSLLNSYETTSLCKLINFSFEFFIHD